MLALVRLNLNNIACFDALIQIETITFIFSQTFSNYNITISNAGTIPNGVVKYSNVEPVYDSWDVTVKVSN